MILAPFVQPLIVGSAYIFIPGCIAAMLGVLRTQKEDEMLQKELRGYQEYAEKVIYKLIPGVW